MGAFKKGLVWIICIVVVLALGGAGAYYYFFEYKERPIKVGGLFDLTGPTSDVGVDYSLGVKDAVRWINDHGGINGRRIELISNDYGYDIPKAVRLYKRYRNKYNIEFIQGWGTGDTENLRGRVNRQGVIYMSGSYSAAMTDPFYTPYNFFIGTDYSTSLRLAIKYIKQTHSDPSRPPRMMFIYPDHPYGRAPIPAGKRMAAELGVEYGPDQILPLDAKDATEQLRGVQEYDPEWVWLGGTLASCAVIIRDAGELGVDTKFIINTWGFDERLLEEAGPYANGRAYGITPTVMWGEDVPGMRNLQRAYRKYRSAEEHTIHYVKGWVSMMVMAEGMRRAGEEVNARNVKEALETLRGFNLGGLAPPITYTPEDHRPNTQVKIYKIEGGKYVLAAEVKMPRDSRFIGW